VEIITLLAGLSMAMVGSLLFISTIQRLKKRLRVLEQNENLMPEKSAAQFNKLLETAEQQFEQRLNANPTLSTIDTATRQAIQQIISLREAQQLQLHTQLQTTLQQLERAKQQVVEELNQSGVEFSQLKHEVEQLLARYHNQFTEMRQHLESRQPVLKPPAQQFLELEKAADLAQIQLTKTDFITPVESSAAEISGFIATLSEISFETVFINSNHLVQRELKTARQLTELLPDGIVLELIYIPGGTFIMGSEETEFASPPHSVSLKPFLVGKYPITQAQWEAVMGNNPSKFRGKRHPVEMVNWREAVRFCAKLSQLTGAHYQLLTESRWEYACRAGSMTCYSFGEGVTPELANYEGSGIKHTSEVGMYPANAFGLYDMHGNVWEWCEDTWHENYVDAPNDGTAWDGDNPFIRLLRGGSWYNTAQKLHSATRIGFDTTSRYDNEGFRVMRLVEIS